MGCSCRRGQTTASWIRPSKSKRQSVHPPAHAHPCMRTDQTHTLANLHAARRRVAWHGDSRGTCEASRFQKDRPCAYFAVPPAKVAHICAHIHTRIHAHMRVRTHTHTHMHARAHAHARAHTHIHLHLHTYTRTFAHTCMHTHARAHRLAHIQARIHAHIHTREVM